MEFTREIKEQFIEMFGNHEIVTVSHKYGYTASSWESKFIGVRNGMKWDFTPLVIELSGCKSNEDKLGARGFSKEILRMALRQLLNDNFDVPAPYLTSVGDFCQIFYF